MSTSTLTRPAPFETLADLPTGTRFMAAGKTYTMADGFQIEPAASRAWFNATDAVGSPVRVKIGARTRVIVLG